MTSKHYVVAAVWMAIVALPVVSAAQHHDLTHEQAADENAVVGFGVLPVGTSLGPEALCLVVGTTYTFPGGITRPAVAADIGGPNDPCSYKNHHLTPEEVTIFQGGQVTFQVHGGGHAMAIYEVSKDTTRDDIGQCPGFDRTLAAQYHPCLTGLGSSGTGAANAAAAHDIADGKGDVVIVAAAADTSPTGNRVWSEPGRLMSAGGIQFLNGGTTVTNGELVTYRFLKTGRYLVICMNRSHFLNDWMFGFVNVVGGN
jgi:plastocyanin